MPYRPSPILAAFKVFFCSILGGAICGWAGMAFSLQMWGMEAAIAGAFVGLCLSPFEIGMLHNRSLERAAPIILIPSMLVSASATIISGGNYGFSLLSIPVFMALTIYARFKLPSTLPKPGHCPTCGYNLTGLKLPPGAGRDANPICPECGFDPN